MNDLIFNPFHKKTFFPSITNSFQFNQNHHLYYTSGNKLISFDIIKGFKIFRLNLNGVRIISFILSKDNNGKIYCLDSNNLFFEYDFLSKAITSSIQLKHNYSMICYSNGKYYLYGKNMLIAITEVVPSEKGTIIALIDECNISFEERQAKPKEKDNFNAQESVPKLFDVRNEYVIISNSNILLVLNTISKKTKQIAFQRKITCGCFISNDQLVIGDIGGKMHFISEFNQLNYILSTKHWHAHRVHSLVLDSNESFLYSGGEEGVIVIWNLKNNTMTYIPRINGSIMSLAVSSNSKYLSANLSDGSIKIISLPNMKVIQEINSITKDSIIKKTHMFNEDYIIFGGRPNGLIQFYNINQNTFPFELNIMNKNFVSQTEREIVNRKQLKHLNVIFNKESDDCYMLTIEEIDSGENDDTKKVLITYMKFWRITKDNIDLITQGENPHMNELIKITEGRSYYHHNGNIIYSFLTGSDSHFKLWTLQRNESNPRIEKFICSFSGKYKDTPLTSCLISNKDIIYSLHKNYLIKWNLTLSSSGIEAIYSFIDDNDKDIFTLKRINKSTICLYSHNKLLAFSTEKWEELWCEEFANSKMKIINIMNDIINNEVVVIIQSTINDMIYALRYEEFEGKKLGAKCQVLAKKGIEYIDIVKSEYIIINNKRDIFISSPNQTIKEVFKEKRLTKKEMDDNDIEMTIKPKKQSNIK